MESSNSDQVIADLIDDLDNASTIPAKQRAIKISVVVEKLISKAYEDGLSNASLDKLLDIITLPSELDQASLGVLVKNMYPADKVTDSIIVKVVGSLGHGRNKCSFAIQALFLKWLIMVYEVLEHPEILSQLYGVLFNLLDTMAIRSPLCHLLSLITRRKHIRTFRIQMLMELARHAGNERSLVGLMRVYKDFYPDIIVGDMTQGRASVFMHPNSEWRERLLEVQRLRSIHTQEKLDRMEERFKTRRGGGARSKLDRYFVIPTVHTSRAQEISTTLEEIESALDFIQRLERIEMPNQLVAVMDDPLLQKLLQLRSSAYDMQRVDSWLLAFFEDQLQSAEDSDRKILNMLSAVRSYTQYTKVLPPACIQYLRAMFPLWNGLTGREVILDLLTYAPVSTFNETYQSTFKALEEAVLADATGKVALLKFYTGLLRQWTATLLTNPESSASDGVMLKELIEHTNKLALTLLQIAPKVSSYSTILDFYEQVAAVNSHPKLTQLKCIILPPEQLIYFLQFTSSISIISRLCRVLTSYKKSFEAAMLSKATGNSHVYPKDYVNRFNGFLMDICNCLWRNRAFNTEDANALGCLLPAASESVLTKYIAGVNPLLSLGSLFNLSFSPVLCLFSISYLREEEDAQEDNIAIRHAGPVTQTSLKQLGLEGGLTMSWADYRLGVLQYLEKHGADGIGELMYNTMKHLMRNDKA